MKNSFFTVFLILSGISIFTFNGCEKKAPIIIYQTPAPNSNGQLPQQNAPVYTEPVNPEPAPEDTNSASEEPAAETPAEEPAAEATADAAAETPAAADPVASTDTDSGIVIPDDLPSTGTVSGDASGSAGYSQSGSFNLYQPGLVSKIPLIGGFLDSTTTVNKWQAVGVAAFGSNLFITAQDKTGLSFFKGTVLKMNAADGTGFTNLGKQWLGLKYQMDQSVKGIAMDSAGNIYANDSKTFLYSLPQPAYTVLKVSGGFSDSIDITTANNSIYVATSSGLKKYEPSALTSGTEFAAGVIPSGGIGSDPAGNIYVVTSGSIKKITASGSVTDFITGAAGAIDVVGTESNKVCVLTSEGIQMYDAAGKLLSSFGLGDYSNGTAIAASGKDLYVADAGVSYTQSKIVKYSEP